MESSVITQQAVTVVPVEVTVAQNDATQIAQYNSQGNASTVEKEQRYLRQKSKRISQFIKNIKSGETKPAVPSNNHVESFLTGGANGIDKFQNSDRGSKLPEQNQKVLGDIKEILVQENAILSARNDEEQLQNFVHNSVVVAKDIGNNALVKEVVKKWKAELIGTMQNNDWRGIAKLGGDIISTMRQTEALLELLVELAKIVKIFNNKIGVERSVSLEERDVVLKEVQSTLKVLSANPFWKQAISVTDPVPTQMKDEIKVLKGVVDQSHLDQLTQSGQAVLQSIVGDAISVQPFINATLAASRRIFHDRQFLELVHQVQILLTQIAENPDTLDDTLTQASMKLMLDKLEFAVNSLLQNEDVVRARTETDKLMAVIKQDPMNRALLADFQKLRADANPADIISSVRTFLVPVIIEHLNNVPLSAIKTTINAFGTRHVEIYDLKLAARDFLPKDIHVKLKYEFDGNAQEMSVSEQKIVAKIDVKNLQINVTDASWKSTGSTVDGGKASFHTGGKGISLSLELLIVPGGSPFLTVKRADCKMDKFSLVFTESLHDKMYSFVTSMASRSIRKNVEKTITNKIKEMGPLLEVKLNQMMGQSKAKLGEMQTRMQQKQQAKAEKKQQKRAGLAPTPITAPVLVEAPVVVQVPTAQSHLEAKIAALEGPEPVISAHPLGMAQN